MTSTASALPALPPNAPGRSIVERVNALVRWFNRPDMFVPIYAADTGSGTAYVITPSSDVKFYEVGQVYVFKATNANTGTAPTLAVQGLTAGTITYPDGSALVPGDIPANGLVEVIVASTTPTFHLQSPNPRNSGATTFATGNVNCVTINTFVNGPNTGSIGANGQTWLIEASGIYVLGGGGGQGTWRIHNGTSGLKDSCANIANGCNYNFSISVVVALTAATTFTLQACDNVGGSAGGLVATGTNGTTNKATSITAVRLA